MAAWTLPAMILDWCEFVTNALDRRSRKYFFNIILGMILSCGRRTVSCWLRSGDVSEDWQDHYYFLQTLGRSAKRVATQLLHLAVRHIPVSHVGNLSNSQSIIRPRVGHNQLARAASAVRLHWPATAGTDVCSAKRS